MKRDLILPHHTERSSDNQAWFGLVTKFLWLLRPFWIWWSPPFLKFVVVRRRHAVDAVRVQELGDPLHRPLAVVLSLQYKNKHLSKTLYYTQSEYCLFFWFFCSPGLIENLALYWIERFNCWNRCRLSAVCGRACCGNATSDFYSECSGTSAFVQEQRSIKRKRGEYC